MRETCGQFYSDLEELGVVLSAAQTEQFYDYYKLLTEWNKFVNLTAIMELEEVFKKHFIDSLCLVRAVSLTDGLSLLDVGTGAGFPGLPLKIAFPGLKVTLLDSLNKRVRFLKEVVGCLGITGVEIIHGRAEDYARPDKLRESFDLCVSRAVANMTTLSEYCLPFVKTGGRFISYKSEKIKEESGAAAKAIAVLGGRPDGQVEFTLPSSDISRTLFIVEKVKRTPSCYPRKAGLPAKEPLR